MGEEWIRKEAGEKVLKKEQDKAEWTRKTEENTRISLEASMWILAGDCR
jgi:hypothetical protein